MGGKMSRNKGQRGEREIVGLLQPIVDKVYGLGSLKLKRNALQSDGGGFDLHGIDWLAVEVKFQESFNLKDWWRQTESQAERHQIPVLIYRKSRVPWRVRMHGYLPADSKKVRCLVDIPIDAFLIYFEAMLKERLIQD